MRVILAVLLLAFACGAQATNPDARAVLRLPERAR